MALIANEKFLAIAFQKTVLIYDLPSDERSHVPTISCSRSHKYLSVADDSKQLHIYNTDDWTLVNSRTIPKRCTSMVFTKDDSSVLLADKSGDVNSFPVSDSQKGHLLIMGHVSMLIDLALCKNDKFLVTCDRDEKIRVSFYPNSYNIATFCLGHLDFVSQLVYVEDKEMLISGSGDGMIKVWNFMTGQEMESFDCLPHVGSFKDVKCPNLIPNQSEKENTCRGVDVRNISYQRGSSLMVVSFERRSDVLILDLEDGKLKLATTIAAEGNVLDLKFSDSFLFVLHLTYDIQNMFLSCYKITKGESCNVQPLGDVSDVDVALLEGIKCLNIKLSMLESEVSKVTDWSRFNCSLHKMHIDNMTEYVDRKQQRMEEVDARKIKKQKI